MSNLHADHYADHSAYVTAPIVENLKIAEATYRLRVSAPDIASRVIPGQFLMLRLDGLDAPLIGRALAIYDVIQDSNGRADFIDVVYVRKGALTSVLADCQSPTRVSIWGPLGNGFRASPCKRLILAAGGIGQTPMLLVGKEALGTYQCRQEPRQSWAQQVELIYGARRQSLLAGIPDFEAAGFEITLCTDDGSAGKKELVPNVLAERLNSIQDRDSVRVVTCGPEIMMEKVAEVCKQYEVDCQVSMETPMACGIGICFSCVARIRQDDGGWDYKRTCVEGPIFDADRICW